MKQGLRVFWKLNESENGSLSQIERCLQYHNLINTYQKRTLIQFFQSISVVFLRDIAQNLLIA